jgi:hypothetical protein
VTAGVDPIMQHGFLSQWIHVWQIYVQVDEHILQDVVCLGFDRTQLAESLVNHAQNKVLMNYWV